MLRLTDGWINNVQYLSNVVEEIIENFYLSKINLNQHEDV